MNDLDGPEVATLVYQILFAEKTKLPHPDIIPRALDAATRNMRERGIHPSRWATYIHMGV
jgi:hypothetical protein